MKKSWILGALGSALLTAIALMVVLVPAEEVIAQQPAMGYSHAVKFVCGSLEEDTPFLTAGVYRTEINIYNHNPDRKLQVDKTGILLVKDYDAIGREPEQSSPGGFDQIDLNPNHATMDDCQRISEILGLPWPATGVYIGFLDVVAQDELTVDAVYTSRNAAGGGSSIEVERVEGKVRCP